MGAWHVYSNMGDAIFCLNELVFGATGRLSGIGHDRPIFLSILIIFREVSANKKARVLDYKLELTLLPPGGILQT